jgi:hypothetical protein
MVPPYSADRFQPAQRPTEEVRRRHQDARHAAENRLQQAADQAHVVVQRQPADDHVVGVHVDAETVADQQFVGHQIAVADLHALGQRGGAGGVLQEGDVLRQGGSIQFSASVLSSVSTHSNGGAPSMCCKASRRSALVSSKRGRHRQ